MDLRQNAFNMIRRALYGVLMRDPSNEQAWSLLEDAPLSMDRRCGSPLGCSERRTHHIRHGYRGKILSAVAIDAERAAMLMCSTPEGYNARIREKVDAVKVVLPQMLKSGPSNGTHGEFSDEEAYEDAQEVVVLLNRACKVLDKGKGRAK